jgi:hypothetical protein
MTRSKFQPGPETGHYHDTIGVEDSVTIRSRTIVLTNAQIKALPSTPVEIVPAPESNEIIAPIGAWLYLNWHADYSNIDPLARIGIGITGTLSSVLSQFADSSIGDLLQDGASHVAFTGIVGVVGEAVAATLGTGQIHDEPGVLGRGAEIYGANNGLGDFTGGHAENTLSVSLWYGIVTVPNV